MDLEDVEERTMISKEIYNELEDMSEQHDFDIERTKDLFKESFEKAIQSSSHTTNREYIEEMSLRACRSKLLQEKQKEEYGTKRELVQRCIIERYVENDYNSYDYSRGHILRKFREHIKNENGELIDASDRLPRDEWVIIVSEFIADLGGGWLEWSTNYTPAQYDIAEWRWEELQRGVLERDGYTCKECGEGDDVVFHIHHVIPRYLGGENVLENLITLCSECHSERHHWMG